MKKNRFDAHEYCLSIGGYLVEIDTEEEEDWLLGAFAVYDQVWEPGKHLHLHSSVNTAGKPEEKNICPPFSVNTHRTTGLG